MIETDGEYYGSQRTDTPYREDLKASGKYIPSNIPGDSNIRRLDTLNLTGELFGYKILDVKHDSSSLSSIAPLEIYKKCIWSPGYPGLENIIIDEDIEKDESHSLTQIYANLLRDFYPRQNSITHEDILTDILLKVREVMPYDFTYLTDIKNSEVEKIRELYKQKTGNGYAIPLTEYTKAGTGVCRHQNLLYFYLVNKFLTNPSYKSKFPDNTFITVQDGAGYELDKDGNKHYTAGHLWCQVSSGTPPDQMYIADCSNFNRVFPLEFLVAQEFQWNYKLPNNEDYLKRKLPKNVMSLRRMPGKFREIWEKLKFT